jgi:hypothetical protein
MHFALFVHFYCPIVSLFFDASSYVSENVKCSKRSNSSAAIAHDPNDSITPSPVKMTEKEEEILDVVVKNRNLAQKEDNS